MLAAASPACTAIANSAIMELQGRWCRRVFHARRVAAQCAGCTFSGRRRAKASWCAVCAVGSTTCWWTCDPPRPASGAHFAVELSAADPRGAIRAARGGARLPDARRRLRGAVSDDGRLQGRTRRRGALERSGLRHRLAAAVQLDPRAGRRLWRLRSGALCARRRRDAEAGATPHERSFRGDRDTGRRGAAGAAGDGAHRRDLSALPQHHGRGRAGDAAARRAPRPARGDRGAFRHAGFRLGGAAGVDTARRLCRGCIGAGG